MKLLMIATALTGFACADSLPLIPLPVSVTAREGAFEFSAGTAIRFDRDLKTEADLFAADLQALTGTAPKTAAEELRIFLHSEIRLDLDAAADLPAGGYKLVISPGAVVVTGKDSSGVYHGTRTILQLLPPRGAAIWKDETPARLPALEITDYPRFGWRGMMLDVGRHFYPVADIKDFIDWMAFHKLNTLHWHLTEDQGWRIEIRKYPKLTEVGAYRESSPPYGNRKSDDGVRYGGFYTQDQIREIVAYAAARHITIIPEIEMPGHAAAAIASYPELGNTDIPGYAPKVMTRWGVHPYTFAPKEETFRFLEDVLGEVCELFPSKFIHIGGDEAPKTQWRESKFAQEVMKREGLKNEEELQSWFVRRIGKFLKSKNRRLIGWDEIQEGGLDQSATMMVWRDAKWARHALALGNDVVMATTSHTYFDYYQNPAAAELAKGDEYEAIGGDLPLAKVYSYNPASVAETPAQEKQILGTQAQLWTEYAKDMKKVQYLAFPRIAALAEVAWTPHESKILDDFLSRLDGIMKHYDAGKLNYCKPAGPPGKEGRDGSRPESPVGGKP
ncbi:MAG: beta-N-acetylhexosaminidase [Luteolibacter sp.]|jgi:hexosaminidase|nr:beta-N-acetylhexosaminidase [Luteolibacter sp.]